MTFNVTVLGVGAAYTRPGGNCSGFLVKTDTTTVWLECGNGTFSALQRHTDYRELDAIVISHEHPDHFADLAPAYYAYAYDCKDVTAHVRTTSGVQSTVKSLVTKHSTKTFERVFDFDRIDEPFKVGDLMFEPFETVHSVETYGFRITDGASTLVYTSDTGWFDALPEVCSGADLLIADCTYVETHRQEAPPNLHLFAAQAGELGRSAHAKRLLLTHTWPSSDLDVVLKEARQRYPEAELAVEDETYEVG